MSFNIAQLVKFHLALIWGARMSYSTCISFRSFCLYKLFSPDVYFNPIRINLTTTMVRSLCLSTCLFVCLFSEYQ